MITSTNPQLNRVKYAAMLIGAGFTVVASTLQYSAVATAEPNSGAWDVIAFDDCLKKYNPGQAGSEEEMEARIKWCCLDTGGVWKDNGTGTAECVAPSFSNPSRSQRIRSAIESEPLTPSRPPIPNESDIGTATVTSIG
jgi:hypothetical protein